MDLLAYFRILAQYNRIANTRLFEACSKLTVSEYKKHRDGSLGSIHGLLNHLLLGDRIWMARFEGKGYETPALNTELFNDFAELKLARISEDERIERFFATAPEGLLTRSFPYRNNKGFEYVEQAPVAIGHFFNHQTHHRGQVHVMLSQAAVAPPSLDLHRIVNP